MKWEPSENALPLPPTDNRREWKRFVHIYGCVVFLNQIVRGHRTTMKRPINYSVDCWVVSVPHSLSLPPWMPGNRLELMIGIKRAGGIFITRPTAIEKTGQMRIIFTCLSLWRTLGISMAGILSNGWAAGRKKVYRCRVSTDKRTCPPYTSRAQCMNEYGMEGIETVRSEQQSISIIISNNIQLIFINILYKCGETKLCWWLFALGFLEFLFVLSSHHELRWVFSLRFWAAFLSFFRLFFFFVFVCY